MLAAQYVILTCFRNLPMIDSLTPLLYVLAVSIVVTPLSHAAFSKGIAYEV